MAYTRQYTQGVGWQNEPSINTPISAENLNQMDNAIQDVDAAAYNEFLAVYAAIAQAGGGNTVNFYIDNASNNTLSSNSSVLSNITLKKDDIIFLYMSVAGDYTQAETGWEVEYKMYVGSVLTTFTAVILDYLHGEGAMWHEDFHSDLALGTWLILRVEDTTHFDCIGRINPASGGGASTLAGLTDTNITNPVDGQALKYNNISGKWENATGNNYSDIITSGTQQLLMVSEESDIFYDGFMTPGNMLFLRASVDCEFESGTYPSFNGWLLSWEDEGGLLMVSPIYDRRDAAQGPIPFAEDISADTLLVFTISNNNYLSLVALIPAGGGGSSTLAGLTDTNISSPSNGQVLMYDSTSAKWFNAAGGSYSSRLFACKVTSITSGTGVLAPNNFSFLDAASAPMAGDRIIVDVEASGTVPTGVVTAWQLQYEVNSATVTKSISDGRNGNAYDPNFDDELTAGTTLLLYVGAGGSLSCLAVITEGGSGASALSDLTDTDISSPANGQVLMYNGTEWENADIPVDDALSDSSENPVQNSVVKAALDGKAANTVATTAAVGLVKPDNSTIEVANDGTISVLGGSVITTGDGSWEIVGKVATYTPVNPTGTGSFAIDGKKATFRPAST